MADMDQGIGRDSSIGERLRGAREARGLTLDDVATQTRIPLRHLRAIEEGSWSDLPAITYTVGFARSYANAVGLDGAEVGREVRDEVGGTAQPSQLSPVYYSPPDPARVPSRPLAWIAALFAILLIGGYLWWRSRLASDDQMPKTPIVAEQPTGQPEPAQQQQPIAPANPAGQNVQLRATDTVAITVRDGQTRIASRNMNPGDTFDLPAGLQQPSVLTYRPQALTAVVGGRELGALGTKDGRVVIPLGSAELTQRLAAAPANAAPVGDNAPRPGL